MTYGMEWLSVALWPLLLLLLVCFRSVGGAENKWVEHRRCRLDSTQLDDGVWKASADDDDWWWMEEDRRICRIIER